MYPGDKKSILKSQEPNLSCPNCAQKTVHKATWGNSKIYACPQCDVDWEVTEKDNGEIEKIERFFFG